MADPARTRTAKETEFGFADALVRLTHLVQRVFADVSRAHDLTPQQAQLLCVLTRGPAGMTELSHVLYLEKSSLTGLVDRIERRGLVVRQRSSHDRRACQVALTDKGTRLAHETHDAITARLESLAGDLSRTDRERVTSVVVRLLGGAVS
ncbi:DNA-binding MarR family transcriptional regulator [Streptomyces sp. Amel2xB2]|uniref:Transcriptional regulator n=1 Tax=Streptomyces nanshensis TaxID=518642 RepID=A0A1E7L9D9_9ACTN|nr:MULTISPECIES: MarR family winged helix-turn-helix transcriptional regulator [Streptomyces]OEV12845.1 transcriptional regulator [Streptomyces nanshensis]RAJ68752.1 DNA-binding MarR family transcriptional regulator [Streptomyces sp. Amel2xB2]